MVGEAAGEVVGGELVAREEGVEGEVGGELAEEGVVGLEVGGVVCESAVACQLDGFDVVVVVEGLGRDFFYL